MSGTESSRGRSGRALIVAAAFLVVSYLALRHTPVLTPPQGREYVRAAASLAGGGGFEVRPGVPLASYAPLYAMLLTPFALTGQEVVPAVYLLNCLALTAGLLGFYWLAREMDLPGAGVAAVLFGLWAVHYYLLRSIRPDGLAISMTLLTLAAMLRYGHRRSWANLVPVVAFGSLAAMSRYMTALTVLPVLAVGVAVLSAGPARTRCLRGAGIAFLAGLPISVWVGRNWALTGHLFGMSRTTARLMAEGSDLWTNVVRLGKTLVIDLFAADALGTLTVIYGETSPTHPERILASAAIAFVVVVFAVVRGTRRGGGAGMNARRAVGLVLYPAFYVVALLTLWTLGNNDPIHTRFVAPVYPFLALAFLALCSRLRSDGLALAALALAAALVLIPSSIKSIALLGAKPEQKLLELQGRMKRGERWHADVPWEGRTTADEGAE